MKAYKVNHKLYLSLLSGAIVITLLSICIPMTLPWFTVVAGLGCGGFASIIVAWLIESANCAANNKKATLYREEAFSELFSSFETGIQPFIFRIEELDNRKAIQEHTWDEWLKIAYVLSDNEHRKKWFISSYIVFARDILEKSKMLNYQRTQLLQDGIIDELDSKTITRIVSWCTLVESEKEIAPSCDFFFEKIPTMIKVLKVYLEKSTSMNRINDLKTKSILER